MKPSIIRRTAMCAGAAMVVAALGLAGTIYDSGPPVDIDLSGRAMPDALEESGRGIPLIHLLVDTLSYDRVDDRNRWRIERSARRAA